MNLQKIIIVLLVLLAVIITLVYYPQLPAIVPSHWNALGEVDGYVSKTAHVYLFLGLCAGIPTLLLLLPRLDPKYKNIAEFINSFHWFAVVMTAFMVGLYIYTTAYALGYIFPIQLYIIPAMAILFFSIGAMLGQTKSNYTIGIRLPWTLNSEKNWNKTHQIASQVFKYGAAILLFSTLFGSYAFAAFLSILVGMLLIPTIYSYILHRKGI